MQKNEYFYIFLKKEEYLYGTLLSIYQSGRILRRSSMFGAQKTDEQRYAAQQKRRGPKHQICGAEHEKIIQQVEHPLPRAVHTATSSYYLPTV